MNIAAWSNSTSRWEEAGNNEIVGQPSVMARVPIGQLILNQLLNPPLRPLKVKTIIVHHAGLRGHVVSELGAP